MPVRVAVGRDIDRNQRTVRVQRVAQLQVRSREFLLFLGVRAAGLELRQQGRDGLRLRFATREPVRVGLADLRIVLQRPLVDGDEICALRRVREQRTTASRNNMRT
jgi:hypothetical protein